MSKKNKKFEMLCGNEMQECTKFSEPYIQRKDSLAFEKSIFIINVEKIKTSPSYVKYLLTYVPIFVYSKIISEHESNCTVDQMKYIKKLFLKTIKL